MTAATTGIGDRKGKVGTERNINKNQHSRKLIKIMNKVLGSFMSQSSAFTLEKSSLTDSQCYRVVSY